nr:MAG TPA: hypothetical protein [Caudoviricetes sp.]
MVAGPLPATILSRQGKCGNDEIQDLFFKPDKEKSVEKR